MSGGLQRPYTQVKRIADMLLERLAPACHRIEIAGSLRRKRPFVGDIEFVAVPILGLDLFKQPTGDSAVDALLAMWPIELKLNGNKQKQFVVTTTAGERFAVDLFLQPDPVTWGINMMIRTGSAEFSKRMVTPQYNGGYMPSDLFVRHARAWRRGEAEPLATPEETDVFELWGMEFVPPEGRN